jgi:hypothetical protein
MLRRFSTFALLVGLCLVALFVLSDMARDVNYTFLVLGTLCILLAIGIRISSPTPPPTETSARFRLLKRIMDREEKEKGKKKP